MGYLDQSNSLSTWMCTLKVFEIRPRIAHEFWEEVWACDEFHSSSIQRRNICQA